MSIDHHFYVPVGMRNSETRRFSDFKYSSLGELRDAGHLHSDHQVFLAHSGAGDVAILVDEQFYFEDAEDARWFYREGYKRMLYEGEKCPERLVLCVDDVEQAWQINGREMKPEPMNGKDCNCLATQSCPAPCSGGRGTKT
jgi:hypothetical protein